MVPKQAKDPKFSEPAVEVAVYKQTPDLYLLHLILDSIGKPTEDGEFTSKHSGIAI